MAHLQCVNYSTTSDSETLLVTKQKTIRKCSKSVGHVPVFRRNHPTHYQLWVFHLPDQWWHWWGHAQLSDLRQMGMSLLLKIKVSFCDLPNYKEGYLLPRELDEVELDGRVLYYFFYELHSTDADTHKRARILTLMNTRMHTLPL